MQQIQGAVIECMEATLGELKRSCTNVSCSATIRYCNWSEWLFFQVDLDDFTVENALFRNFDRIVRHQLDPVWHRVGNKTKKLVADLTQLRQLLT
jgi:DNA excision repair protein ERCC-4